MNENKMPPAIGTGARKSLAFDSTLPRERDRAINALEYIDPRPREMWVQIGMALKSGFGESGFEVWDEWSQQAESYDATIARSQWRSFKPDGGIGMGTLYYEAHRAGWSDVYDEDRINSRAAMRSSPADERREKRADHAERATEAGRRMWDAATALSVEHAYVHSRAVTPQDTLRQLAASDAARLLGYVPKSDGVALEGDLIVVPLTNGETFVGVELIDGRGRKCVPAGTRAKGAFWTPHPLTDGTDGPVLIGEGVATMLSALDATGAACVAARFAGNLPVVAAYVSARYPHAEIIVLGEEGGGLGHARAAARGAGAKLAIFEDDANDLYRRQGPTAVRERIARAEFVPIEAAPATGSLQSSVATDWPAPLAPEAFHGLCGEVVRALEPHTEADPAGILLQTLCAFGALVGPGPHHRIEGDKHRARLFAIIAGRSSKARKGTSWGRVRSLYAPIREWPGSVEGLSSGEGLKYRVRDPVNKTEKDGTVNQVDSGVLDKRLMVMESEFAQVLRQCDRPGNTLSPTLRSLWDSGDLQSLTKNDPIVATGAHVCIVGQITRDELRAELTATDAANGFANRFLFMAVDRSKRLAFGGEQLHDSVVTDLSRRLAHAADIARNKGHIPWSEAARPVWESVYEGLSEGQPGLVGAVTARAEAQVLRLALLYALMDEANAIDVIHLRAAVAVWERCEASAMYLFGACLGNRLADVILGALRTAPDKHMSRTEISRLFSKNETADKIGSALQLLEQRHLAYRQKIESAGRPAEIWTAN